MRFPNQTHNPLVSVGGEWSFPECRSGEMAGTIRPPSRNRRSCTEYYLLEFSTPTNQVCQQLQSHLQLAKRSSEVALRLCASCGAFRQKAIRASDMRESEALKPDHSGRIQRRMQEAKVLKIRKICRSRLQASYP
jgi:hypothetical protein